MELINLILSSKSASKSADKVYRTTSVRKFSFNIADIFTPEINSLKYQLTKQLSGLNTLISLSNNKN